MSLLIAPYNNAMRLGQGFNSFTQQICVDDAVVIDPDRAENVITNDGTTMRIIAQSSAKPSAWTRQGEVISDERARPALIKREALAIEEGEISEEEASPTPDSKDDESAEDDTDEASYEAPKDTTSEEEAPPATEDENEPGVGGSDSGSLEKIEHNDADDGEAEEDNSNTESIVPQKHVQARMDVKVSKIEDDSADIDPSEADEGAKQPIHQGSAMGMRSSPTGRKLAALSALKSHGKEETKRPTQTPEISNKVKCALTMSQLSKAAKLRKQKEAEAQKKEAAEKEAREKEENERIAEQRAYQKELEKEAREDERKNRAADREEKQKIQEEKRQYDAQRRAEAKIAIDNAAKAKAEALTIADLEKIKAQNQFVERFNGMVDDEQKYTFNPTAPRGPSQTVVYTSRFVDKLSDITDDMSISGSLSIKAAKVGGSGRGSFVDSDKFKESDLNFYISVKVINQTLNFKDALVYNPIRSVGADTFQQVYGDSFISGFLEGGEFNALVSMKILNKAKMTDIKAEAKVAFTAGPMDVTAEANVGIARSNIETNTETTIQVSWCGGGHIKPMEQQWDIKSLMQAAARFPDLAAECPQRTYAILTKYETLRSFVALKPESYTKLQYENAQIYTNSLMDSFMAYKSLYKRLGEQIFNIQGKTMKIVPWPAVDASATDTSSSTTTEVVKIVKKDKNTGMYPYVEDRSKFEASLGGLSDARKAIRRQMARIVNEVDLIEGRPKLATDEDHSEPFQSPVTFETRLPVVEVPNKLRQKAEPLTGKRIMAKTQTEEEQKLESDAQEEAAKAPALYADTDEISMEEKTYLGKLKDDYPGIGQHLRVSSAVGNADKGVPFTNLDFLQPDWEVQAIRVEVASGAISAIEVLYENGLILKKGKFVGGLVKELTSFLPGERITYASLEYGELPSEGGTRVLAIRLFTNHGRRLLGQAATNEVVKGGVIKKDGVVYEKVTSIYVDSPFQKGTFRGFFGRCDDSDYKGITRLGLIWGDLYRSTKVATMGDTTGMNFDYSAQSDSAEVQALRNALAEKDKALLDAQSGKKMTTSAQGGVAGAAAWKDDKADLIDINPVRFNPPYPSAPCMISGLTMLDQLGQHPIRLEARHQNVTPTGFEVMTRTFGAPCYMSKIGWMTLPENEVHFETGVYTAWGVPKINNNQSVVNRTYFPNRFNGNPSVVTWIYEVNMNPGWHSITTGVSAATEDYFDFAINTWANRTFENIRIGWLAFNATGCNHPVKVGYIRVLRGEGTKAGKVAFDGIPFTKTPAVFIALMEFDAGDDRNVRFRGDVSDITAAGFNYNCGTWADTNMDHAQWVWVATE